MQNKRLNLWLTVVLFWTTVFFVTFYCYQKNKEPPNIKATGTESKKVEPSRAVDSSKTPPVSSQKKKTPVASSSSQEMTEGSTTPPAVEQIAEAGPSVEGAVSTTEAPLGEEVVTGSESVENTQDSANTAQTEAASQTALEEAKLKAQALKEYYESQGYHVTINQNYKE